MAEQLYVASSVWEEVVLRGQGRPGVQEMQQAKFIEKRSVQNRKAVEMLQVFMDSSETESLLIDGTQPRLKGKGERKPLLSPLSFPLLF